MTWQVTAENISKSFIATDGSAVDALKAIDLRIKPGEFCVLVGDSGSGKTTLMRSIAGLEKPDAGRITLRGKTVFAPDENLFEPPQTRRIGMVFQSYAIWPHLTVAENVGLPLRSGVNKVAKGEVDRRVREALEVVGLAALANRPAPALSGGQQQRVALARALAVSTDLLIMDEPMSNLDARLREDVRWQIKEVTRKFGTTVLYVTHDQSEAMALADEITIVRAGHVVIKGPPEELYGRASDRSIADFFGPVNYLEGEVVGENRIHSAQFGEFAVSCLHRKSGTVTVGIRADDTIVVHEAGPNRVRGQVVDEVYQGSHSLVTVDSAGMLLKGESKVRHRIGDAVWAELPAASLRQFDS